MRQLALLLLLSLTVLFLAGNSSLAQPQVQDGDIIFQTPLSSQSLAIQQAINSRYSHMGLILIHDGRPYVYEASATVRYPLQQRIDRGEHSQFYSSV